MSGFVARGEHLAQVTLDVWLGEARGLSVTSHCQLGARGARAVLTGQDAAKAQALLSALERAAARYAAFVAVPDQRAMIADEARAPAR